MKYLLQIYSDSALAEFARRSPDDQEAIVGEYRAIAASPGVIGGEQLQSVETATTVRVQGGQTLLTDNSAPPAPTTRMRKRGVSTWVPSRPDGLPRSRLCSASTMAILGALPRLVRPDGRRWPGAG